MGCGPGAVGPPGPHGSDEKFFRTATFQVVARLGGILELSGKKLVLIGRTDRSVPL